MPTSGGTDQTPRPAGDDRRSALDGLPARPQLARQHHQRERRAGPRGHRIRPVASCRPGKPSRRSRSRAQVSCSRSAWRTAARCPSWAASVFRSATAAQVCKVERCANVPRRTRRDRRGQRSDAGPGGDPAGGRRLVHRRGAQPLVFERRLRRKQQDRRWAATSFGSRCSAIVTSPGRESVCVSVFEFVFEGGERACSNRVRVQGTRSKASAPHEHEHDRRSRTRSAHADQRGSASGARCYSVSVSVPFSPRRNLCGPRPNFLIQRQTAARCLPSSRDTSATLPS